MFAAAQVIFFWINILRYSSTEVELSEEGIVVGASNEEVAEGTTSEDEEEEEGEEEEVEGW